jgi:hypothetical protein
MLRREVLKADDERQRDRLFGLVARLGPGSFVGDALEQADAQLGSTRKRGDHTSTFVAQSNRATRGD